MYKFVMIKPKGGSTYDIGAAENMANQMAAAGYELVQVYQSTTSDCCNQNQSVLVMVFRHR